MERQGAKDNNISVNVDQNEQRISNIIYKMVLVGETLVVWCSPRSHKALWDVIAVAQLPVRLKEN